jgi:guanylate kinase
LFIDQEQFEYLKKRGDLLESATVFGHQYGTSRSQVESQLATGHSVILEIDWQGARQVRESMPGCVTIFVMPPSVAALGQRLRDRDTDNEEVIARRLRDAVGDMQHWHEFDYVIVNNNLREAVIELQHLLMGAGYEQNRSNNPEVRAEVQAILENA